MIVDKLKNYIFFAIFVALNTRLIKLIFKGISIPVYIQYGWLKNYKLNTFIDVGAHRGEELKIINFIFPKAKIYAFEPLVEKLNLIKLERLPKNVVLENVALSDKIGFFSFYLNRYTPASSLLSLKRKLGKYQFLSKVKKVTVKTDTLDNYFKDIKLKKPIVLKLDTQGTEYFILKAGRKLLEKVSIIIVETAFDGLYKGAKKFGDIYKLLVKSGFEFCGSIPDSEFYPNFKPPDYINSVFIKKGERSYFSQSK